LGRPVLGRQETVQKFDRETVLGFYERHYLRGRVIVAAAGHVSHGRVVDRLGGAFAAVAPPPAGDTPPPRRPVPHREVTCRTKDTEQVHLCLGTAGLSLDHEQLYVLQVINTVLGGGLSSRLFQQIRERRGLAYSVYSYHSSYRDSGIFGIYAGLSREKTREVLELICREVLDLGAGGLRPEELRRAKDQLKGGLLLSLESVSTRMSRLAKSELYLRRHLTPEEVVERIERVTEDDVRQLAAGMLRPEDFSVAVVGPWDDCASLRESVGRAL
ncbi:MAG: insulinase family protein, partial [Firmicutes bacterium]|nr:insulinase family protein [Bacillota bacterium]